MKIKIKYLKNGVESQEGDEHDNKKQYEDEDERWR